MLTDAQKSARYVNRQKPPDEIIESLRIHAPEAVEKTRLVGAWLWTTFLDRPQPQTIDALKTLGFSWNAKRRLWQNPCGRFSTGARSHDPRDTYGETPIV